MAKKKTERYTLWNWVENNGDGSVSVHQTVTREAATKKDEAQEPSWGESSVGSCTLEYEDGKLYLVGERWDTRAKGFVEFRNELTKEKKR